MPKQVLIAIQARSGSTRLPKKAFELISGKMLLDRVIEACKSAASYINHRSELTAKIVVVTPFEDLIAKEFRSRCDIVEGPEEDVLRRYRLALDRYSSDFVVRITGDCPLIPPFVISKLVMLADMNAYDYISNVDERFRTTLDGADCEVISARLLRTIDELAVSPSDREHVTPMIRHTPPEWAKIGCVVNHFDHSDLKLSVDTPDDLKKVREHFQSAESKYRQAVMTFGHTAVHRL